MDIKEKKVYTITMTDSEVDVLTKDIEKLNDGSASLEELKILTDIYGFFKNN